mgnify:CR=1 FL=1
MNTFFKLAFFLVLLSNLTNAQSVYIGKENSTSIRFYSDAPLEKIESINKISVPVFNLKTGDFYIRVNMKAFQFKNDLMKEHFNENYVESDKYPYSFFKGKCNISNLEEGKEYEVIMHGIMEIHGVKKNINVQGKITKIKNEILMIAEFYLKPEDFNIKIPVLLKQKIAENVKINFSSILVPYDNK